jgi:superfamily I DNA/RNA helicase
VRRVFAAAYRARCALERLRELVRLARAYEAGAPRLELGDFVSELTLAAGDKRDEGEAVSVLTMHRAKGLEFDHVWVAGVEKASSPTVARCATVASRRNGGWPMSGDACPVDAARKLGTHARRVRVRRPSRYLPSIGYTPSREHDR